MSKILNLDDYADEDRAVTIKGVTYGMRSLTVGEFLVEAKEQEDREAAGTVLTLRQKIEDLCDKLVVVIADIEREVLTNLSFNQLTALMNFSRGEDEAAKVSEAGR